MRYKHVIWDWNGTLLNDVKLGHSLLNYLQGIKKVPLSNFEQYRKMFTFPITDFYKKAGLFESMKSFKDLADIYIKKYEEGVKHCILQTKAEEVLKLLYEKGITNSILTAGPEDMVIDQLKGYGIDKYFTAVTGKKDFYASGKSELTDIHLKKLDYNAGDMIFVGDTVHDMEIAHQIGCDCIIFRNGHQNVEGLLSHETVLVSGLEEAAGKIIGKI